jgi:large subunit ribosomal protein L5
MTKENEMREIFLDTVTLHCSSADPVKLEKIKKLLKLIINQEPKQTLAKKRIPAFKIRPGLHIGYKVTIRKKKAYELLKNLFTGISTIGKKQFNAGFLSFGIKEYIEISSIPYQRDIGIMGFDVVATLKRRGFRIKERKIKRAKIGKKHAISKEETMKFFIENFKINVE